MTQHQYNGSTGGSQDEQRFAFHNKQAAYTVCQFLAGVIR